MNRNFSLDLLDADVTPWNFYFIYIYINCCGGGGGVCMCECGGGGHRKSQARWGEWAVNGGRKEGGGHVRKKGVGG